MEPTRRISHKHASNAREEFENVRQSQNDAAAPKAANRNERFGEAVIKYELPSRRQRAPGPASGRPARSLSSGEKSERLARIRIAEISRVLDAFYKDDAADRFGRADRHGVLGIIEVVANLFAAFADWKLGLAGWLSRRAPSWSSSQQQDLIELLEHQREGYDAGHAGRALKLSEVMRLKLRITQIQPFDLTPAEVAASRAATKKLHDAKRRAALGAKPRSASREQYKPWILLGISRWKFYELRRRERARCDGSDVSKAKWCSQSDQTEKRESVNIESSSSLSREPVWSVISLSSPPKPAGAPHARPAKVELSQDDRDHLAATAQRRALEAWREEQPAIRRQFVDARSLLYSAAIRALSVPLFGDRS